MTNQVTFRPGRKAGETLALCACGSLLATMDTYEESGIILRGIRLNERQGYVTAQNKEGVYQWFPVDGAGYTRYKHERKKQRRRELQETYRKAGATHVSLEKIELSPRLHPPVEDRLISPEVANPEQEQTISVQCFHCGGISEVSA